MGVCVKIVLLSVTEGGVTLLTIFLSLIGRVTLLTTLPSLTGGGTFLTIFLCFSATPGVLLG